MKSKFILRKDKKSNEYGEHTIRMGSFFYI